MATMVAVDSDGRLAEALEQVRAIAITFLGDNSSDMTAFNSSLSKFIQELLPCAIKDLHIQWISDLEESCLVVCASRKAIEIRWANHAMMFSITPHLLYVVALIVKYNVYNALSIRDFQNQNDDYDVRPPCLEDVLQAFSKAGYWKQNLKMIIISHCYMNAVGDDFELDGAYPEALEYLQSSWPSNHGGMESSTVYKVASKSKKLKVFKTGGTCGGGAHMILTETAFDTACSILANTDCLYDAMSVPGELYHDNVADEDFDKVLKALTMGHAQPPVRLRVRKHWDNPRLVIARRSLLEFYLCVNKYRSFFGGRCTRAMVPFVLEHCQDMRIMHHGRYMKCEHPKVLIQRDVLYYVLRESAADWLSRSGAQPERTVE